MFVDVELQHSARMCTSTNHTRKNEIAQSIYDQVFFVDFNGLNDVGMGAEDDVGACIDQGASEEALVLDGIEGVFDAPMLEDDDDIGQAARSRDIVERSFFFAIHMADERDSHAVDFANQHGIPCMIGDGGSEMAKSSGVEFLEHVEIGGVSKIEGVVVGDRDEVKPCVDEAFGGLQGGNQGFANGGLAAW